MLLLDTRVLSETFKPRPHPSVLSWLEANRNSSIHISVLSVGEITRGIRKLEPTAGRRAEEYRNWLETVLTDYEGRILPITVEIMQVWGSLTYELKNTNPELLIAATALEHDLTVVTRNTRHFAATGAKLLNPYE